MTFAVMLCKVRNSVLVKEHVILVCGTDKAIVNGDSVESLVRNIEDNYNLYHRRGPTWSASVCINWMTFQLSIVSYESLEYILKLLVTNDDNSCSRMTAHNVSGSVNGFILREEIAMQEWERGIKPRLISPGSDKNEAPVYPGM